MNKYMSLCNLIKTGKYAYEEELQTGNEKKKI